MALGEIHEATAVGTTDLYYVDVEMYGTPGYGLVYILDAERPALIDTGTGYRYETVLEAMETVGIAPEDLDVIAPTHVHLDHAGGAHLLAEACPDAEVCLYEAGAQFLADPTAIWEGTKEVIGDRIGYYVEPEPIPEERLVELEDGETVDLGDHALEVHHAPGHAFHQAVFYDPANDGVFTGDAAGINSPHIDGVTHTSPPPGFDLDGCLSDIETLRDLDPAALYYAHFGDRETGDLLEKYETVLTDWVERVRAKRAELEDDEAVADYFAARADSADAWGEAHASEEERMNVRGVLHALDQRE
ncbi:Glyoxylase, beta-lactamase superfamily II [Halovenus aranensis]|uniref:Glyoxylase, beta-lactamase superfamily II n=1 Tax=Halovenus aranensis TaxID=890420 RepID=A0A1G8RWS5_9EURY|nr:MBL fold metallo-hydrolase [Halovenus aranensis]SDJ20985.1 Glyoxylase, beta-lactamase superfamily II [Halovenus aranensis]